MKIQCCFFEDQYLENFHPLTLTRPVYDLRVGILTLGEKWMHALSTPERSPSGILRGHLKEVFTEFALPEDDDEALWINPRFIPSAYLVNLVLNLKTNESLQHADHLIAARVDGNIHHRWADIGIQTEDTQTTEADADQLSSIQKSWELFQVNGQQIENDLQLLNRTPVSADGSYPDALLIYPENIYIEEGANIEPGAMIYAKSGPVYVGKGAHIMANSVVRGPSAICEKSVVKMGAKIYEETTIGPVCKVGGEIANTIFHSYSNKAHDGFTGNSVFGQWCNLGADTNTSNLKNNYGTVKVFDWKTKKEYDTGQQFIGTIMGDHSKTGINSMLNTGTLCGVCCNLFSDDYPPKFVPSFSWVNENETVAYQFEKAIEAMERMMQRRSVDLTPGYYKMMKAIFQSTGF